MQTVTASEIKQNSTILQNALKGDMLVTKRSKPFVVVMDYDRYSELISAQKKLTDNWIEKLSGAMSAEDADAVLDAIHDSRANKEINIWS